LLTIIFIIFPSKLHNHQYPNSLIIASDIAAWKGVGSFVRPPGNAPFASRTIVTFLFRSDHTKEPEGVSLNPKESGLGLNFLPQGQSFTGTVYHPKHLVFVYLYFVTFRNLFTVSS